jgi:ABC-type dipeptide/oligopeptide/nickel transport system permease component
MGLAVQLPQDDTDDLAIEAYTLATVCVAVVTQTLADVGYTYLNPRKRSQGVKFISP